MCETSIPSLSSGGLPFGCLRAHKSVFDSETLAPSLSHHIIQNYFLANGMKPREDMYLVLYAVVSLSKKNCY